MSTSNHRREVSRRDVSEVYSPAPRFEVRCFVFTIGGVIVATLVSLARGGRLAHAANANLLWPWMLAVVVSLDLVARALGPGGASASLWLVAVLVVHQGLLLAFIVVNVLRPGMPVVLVGTLCNAAAVLANSGMPVSGGAIRWLGGSTETVAFADSHHLVTPLTRLVGLTDLVPIPLARSVVSVGDVLVVIGLALVIDGILRPPAHASPAGPRSA